MRLVFSEAPDGECEMGEGVRPQSKYIWVTLCVIRVLGETGI